MGPLKGMRIVELAGLGPAPFCGMVMSDLGAEVIRVDRLDKAGTGSGKDVVNRGRRSLALNLKSESGRSTVLRLLNNADALLEGYRPGVMERFGLGPEECLAANPRLVYARMTGWGQQGPLAPRAGHDINYIALSGVLHAMGEADRPPSPPLNLVGDYGGGGMLLAVGVLAALLETRQSGQGQVVDAAMVDGSALLSSVVHGLRAAGQWRDQRQSNLLDGAAHFYRCYPCRDGKCLAVGALEPQFYQRLLALCGIDDPAFEAQYESRAWPELSEKMADVFRRKTRDEWCKLLENEETCIAPVLDFDEAPQHAHNRARQTFVEEGGVLQPGPAPRFSRTPAAIQSPPPRAGEHSEAVLLDCGFSREEVQRLKDVGDII